MNEDIAVPVAFFISVVVIVIVLPIVRATVRRWDRQVTPAGLTPELDARLDRIESIVETIAVEVERLSEGQRFTTRLLSEGAAQPAIQPVRAAENAARAIKEVTRA